MKLFRFSLVLFWFSFCLYANTAWSWGNGPIGNAQTDTVEECRSPPYGTHDQIADRALSLIGRPKWINKTYYLLGTEAPDNRKIPLECGVGPGYDDRRKGHSVKWAHNHLVVRRAIDRAQEEADKAAQAYTEGDLKMGSFYFGAMAHYIGDLSQYGHVYQDETDHSGFETWAKRRTFDFLPTQYEPMTARQAATVVAEKVRYGAAGVPSAEDMDKLWVGRSKNLEQVSARAMSVGAAGIASAIVGTINGSGVDE